MDFLFGSSSHEETAEEKVLRLDEEKEKNFAACVENEHCKMRLADYLQGLKTQYEDQTNNNVQEPAPEDVQDVQESEEGPAPEQLEEVIQAPEVVESPPAVEV